MDPAYVFGQIVAWLFFAALAGALPLGIGIALVVSSRRDVADRAEAIRIQRDRAHVRFWLTTYQNPIGPCQKRLAADMIRYHAQVSHGIITEL